MCLMRKRKCKTTAVTVRVWGCVHVCKWVCVLCMRIVCVHKKKQGSGMLGLTRARCTVSSNMCLSVCVLVQMCVWQRHTQISHTHAQKETKKAGDFERVRSTTKKKGKKQIVCVCVSFVKLKCSCVCEFSARVCVCVCVHVILQNSPEIFLPLCASAAAAEGVLIPSPRLPSLCWQRSHPRPPPPSFFLPSSSSSSSSLPSSSCWPSASSFSPVATVTTAAAVIPSSSSPSPPSFSFSSNSEKRSIARWEKKMEQGKKNQRERTSLFIYCVLNSGRKTTFCAENQEKEA